eukprot:SAG25_NODE_203_length_11965_cov_47.109641_2_plen_156_part_00
MRAFPRTEQRYSRRPPGHVAPVTAAPSTGEEEVRQSDADSAIATHRPRALVLVAAAGAGVMGQVSTPEPSLPLQGQGQEPGHRYESRFTRMAAESRAQELVEQATRRAEQLLADAEVEAARIRAAAEHRASEIIRCVVRRWWPCGYLPPERLFGC